MSGTDKSKLEKKGEYFDKVLNLLNQYQKIMLVTCDNIGSHHMQNIRRMLRGKAILLMGKNTMMRRVIRQNLNVNPKWEQLLQHIYMNIGLIFTNSDLSEIRKIVINSKVPAPAKVGSLAPNDVIIPKGITNLEPTKTAFVQALGIGSKITRNTIEILNDVKLIKEGDKVGSSESTLLQMLDIRPFEYGLKITVVYESGCVYDAKITEMTDDDLLAKFSDGISNVAALSLALNVPTLAAFPHVVLNAYKNLLGIAVETDFVFEQAKTVKNMVENPDAFKSTQTTAVGDVKKTVEKVEEKEEEEKEESEDMGFDLFG